MRICIPIEPRSEGGVYTFVANFRAFLDAQNVAHTADLDAEYDVLFVNSWLVPYDAVRHAKETHPRMRIVQNGGREVTLNGRVEVQGNRFRVTTSDPGGGVLVTEAEEILDLTERYFVVQDPHGEVLIMERPPAVGLTSGGAR